MNWVYYKKEREGNIVKLAIYKKCPESLEFFLGHSWEEGIFILDEMVEIKEEEYKELVNKLHLGERAENIEPFHHENENGRFLFSSCL